MICILLNHLSLYPSAWQYFTGRGGMWISAAEGFFFISGLMVGLIRGFEYKNTKSLSFIANKLAKRALSLYIILICSSLLSLLIIYFVYKISGSIPFYQPSIFKNINNLFWEMIKLNAIFGWSDFLRFYVIFLIISIPMLWLLKKNMWYLVMGIAILCWFEPRLAIFPFDVFYFYMLTYFLLGLSFGYYYDEIKFYYDKFSSNTKKNIETASILLILSIIILNYLTNFIKIPSDLNINSITRSLTLYKFQRNPFTEVYLYNNRSGILRLPIFIILSAGVFFIFKKITPFISKRLDWLIGELGRNSLRAYVVGGIMTLLLRYWVRDTTFVYNTLVSFLFIYIILKLINFKWLKSILPR
jgi:hypothetical protein